MTQQKSENPIEPEGLRKLAQTIDYRRGGEGVSVDRVDEQLELRFATADAQDGSSRGKTEGLPSLSRSRRAPRAETKGDACHPANMEGVVRSLDEAMDDVARNKGAPGPDGKTVQEIQAAWPGIRSLLVRQLAEGSYRPGAARRVEIPKPGGGKRNLGIPNVVDRIVQAALKRVLEPHWEPTFDESSHGFRPGRSCHTALTEACEYLQEEYEVLVDIDLSKFFYRSS